MSIYTFPAVIRNTCFRLSYVRCLDFYRIQNQFLSTGTVSHKAGHLALETNTSPGVYYIFLEHYRFLAFPPNFPFHGVRGVTNYSI
jgi:hypothetical protein